MLAVAPKNSRKNFTCDCTWNGFHILPENCSAVRALQRLVRRALAGKRCAFCPLVLHGSTGAGKTHLATTALKVLSRDTSGISIRSVSAGELSRAGDDEGLSDGCLQACDILIIEDIQYLTARAGDAMCDLIDHRMARRKPLVISASSGPSGLTHLPRRLTSRLAAGLVVQMEPLRMRSRRIILKSAAKKSNTRLCSDALEWLVEQSDGMRSALGLLQNLNQLFPSPAPLDRPTVERVLAETGQRSSERNDPQQIVKRVAYAFNIGEKELLGNSRLRNVLLPRQVAMYLTRELTRLSLPRIAALFTHRDHTTVLHACRKVEALLPDNELVAAIVRQIKRELT